MATQLSIIVSNVSLQWEKKKNHPEKSETQQDLEELMR